MSRTIFVCYACKDGYSTSRPQGGAEGQEGLGTFL